MSHYKKNAVPEFIDRLFRCLSLESVSPEHPIMSWGQSGNSFIIRAPLSLPSHILPKYFSGCPGLNGYSISAFLKLLADYGFRRLRLDVNGRSMYGRQAWEFYHIWFLREQPEALCSFQSLVPDRSSRPEPAPLWAAAMHSMAPYAPSVLSPVSATSSSGPTSPASLYSAIASVPPQVERTLGELHTQIETLTLIQSQMSHMIYSLVKRTHSLGHATRRLEELAYEGYMPQESKKRSRAQMEASPNHREEASDKKCHCQEKHSKLIEDFQNSTQLSMDTRAQVSLEAKLEQGSLSRSAADQQQQPSIVASLTAADDFVVQTESEYDIDLANPSFPTSPSTCHPLYNGFLCVKFGCCPLPCAEVCFSGTLKDEHVKVADRERPNEWATQGDWRMSF